MNTFNRVMRGILAGAALTSLASLVACEEGMPAKPLPQQARVATSPEVAEKSNQDMLAARVEPKGVVAVVEPKVPELDLKSAKLGSWAEVVARAREALDAGQLERARVLATVATKKAPDRSASWNLLGRAQLKKGDRAAAITSFEKAVELNPDSSYAHNNLGLAFIYEERFDEAIDELEDATDCMPVEGYMWNNLGMAYEHLDRLSEAREAYGKAAELEVPNARQNLARLEGVKSIRTARADIENVDDGEGTASPVDGNGGL